GAARTSVGVRLLRRRPSRRRPCAAAPHQDRGRSGEPSSRRDGARAGLQAAGLNSLIRWLGRLRLRRLGLRARITIFFALGAALLSAILAGTTFAVARNNLINQRESTVLSRVYVNASIVRNGLQGGGSLSTA